MDNKSFDWPRLLEQMNVVVKVNPFGLASVKPGTQNDIDLCSKELDFIFPQDYCAFALSIGPGTLGRVRIFCPLAKMSWPDPRLHTFRLRGIFSQTDFKPTHSFPLTELIAFGNDVEESLWYGWSKLAASQGDYSIYCFDEHPKAPPPRKVATDFREFIVEVCLGMRIAQYQLRRVNERKDAVDDSEETWEVPDDEVTTSTIPFEPPPRIFKPFSAGLLS